MGYLPMFRRTGDLTVREPNDDIPACAAVRLYQVAKNR